MVLNLEVLFPWSLTKREIDNAEAKNHNLPLFPRLLCAPKIFSSIPSTFPHLTAAVTVVVTEPGLWVRDGYRVVTGVLYYRMLHRIVLKTSKTNEYEVTPSHKRKRSSPSELKVLFCPHFTPRTHRVVSVAPRCRQDYPKPRFLCLSNCVWCHSSGRKPLLRGGIFCLSSAYFIVEPHVPQLRGVATFSSKFQLT